MAKTRTGEADQDHASKRCEPERLRDRKILPLTELLMAPARGPTVWAEAYAAILGDNGVDIRAVDGTR